jgi:hypothetical protein
MKRRRVQVIEVGDELQVARWFVAYGRDIDDEVRVYIIDGEVTAVTVGDHTCEIALARLRATMPAHGRISYVWRWMRSEYTMRTSVGGML